MRKWLLLVPAVAALICVGSIFAADGKIGWLVAQRPVGQPVPPDLLQGQSNSVTFLYERLITFDSARGMKMVVSLRQGPRPFAGAPPVGQVSAATRWVCYSAWAPLSTGTTCQAEKQLFARAPLIFGYGGVTGDSSVHGVASDAINRIALTLASGRTVSVPLIDNAFLIRLPANDQPRLLVGYDNAGDVLVSRHI